MRHLPFPRIALLTALLASACAPSDADDQAAEHGEGAASDADEADDRDDVASAARPDAADEPATPTHDAGASRVDAGARDAATRDAATPSSDAASEPDARRERPAGDGGERDGSTPREPASAGDADAGCSGRGNVTYSLTRAPAPSAEQTATYARITRAMDSAVQKYNCYTDLVRALRVVYEPSVATADGNVNGNIRFGAQASMNFVTAMHEIGHTFGVGSNEFKAKSSDGRFNGPLATAEIRRITGKTDEFVHTDGTHFWPFGLNYENEYKSEADAVSHCQMVVAIRKDLGQ